MVPRSETTSALSQLKPLRTIALIRTSEYLPYTYLNETLCRIKTCKIVKKLYNLNKIHFSE